MPVVRVSILGPLQVDDVDGQLGPRDRVVLSALALHCGEPVSGDRLADALWGENVPRSWNKVVQGCIVRLRKAMGTDVIQSAPQGYRLAIPPENVDARRFERVLRRARELFELGDAARAMNAADEALAMWRGRPLTDVEDWDPARIEAHRLNELKMEAEELRLDAALRAGHHHEVLAAARSYVDAAPTRERRWELFALAQYRSGGQGDALRTINEARSVLINELGLDPGPDLVALEQAILQQDPALAAPPQEPEASRFCPWPGLPAYGVEDAEQFFGRDAEVDACLRRLVEDGVVVVVGPSGSGKSSLVRAGVAATLERNGRSVVVITPDVGRPLAALSAVPPTGERPVLVVDQCEEAVSAATHPRDVSAFFAALVSHAERGPLVVALRADKVGDVSAHAEFARLVEHGLFLLAPMTEDDLREAIDGPARRAALRLEPGLVDLVVRDVLHEPGALPLMSHALRQTWEHRHGRTLTVASYREIGGIRGAVAQSAEEVYSAVGGDERAKLRELLLRLVSPVDNGEPARVRMPRHLLTGEPGYDALIDRLVAARLLTSDEQFVELAHEALARAWPRLKGWLEEDIEGLRVLRHLTVAATSWDALGQPESELYRGVRLVRAVEWRERARPELTAIERGFLDAAIEREASDLRIAQAQVARERRTVRRLRRLAIGVAVLGAAALVASAVAVAQRGRADRQANIAEARRLSAQGLDARPHDRALLLAVEAVRRWDSEETRGNLLTTIGRSERLARVIRTEQARPLDVELSGDGARALVVDGVGDAKLYDLARRSDIATLAEDDLIFHAPAFSPDGKDVAVSRFSSGCTRQQRCDFGIDVFAATNLRARGITYEGLGDGAMDVAYSPDGTLLAAVLPLSHAPPINNIAIWRVGEPEKPLRWLTIAETGDDRRTSPDSRSPAWVAFAPDSKQLYASGAGPIAVFDVATGRQLRTLDGEGGMALSPDGTTLATTGTSKVRLLNTGTGEVSAELVGHSGVVTAAAFSTDGRRVATTSNDETVMVWETGTGRRLDVLHGHAGSVLDVVFGRDGTTLLSSAADRSLFVWDIDRSSGLANWLTDPANDVPAETTVLVSPTADSVAILGERVLVVELQHSAVTELAIEEPRDVAWAAFRPDGRRLVTVGGDGDTKLFSVPDGRLMAARAGRASRNFGAVAFATDGRTVAVADANGSVVELNGVTLAPTGKKVAVGVEAGAIRMAAGSRFAVAASPADPSGGTDIVFGNLQSQRVLRRMHIASWGPRTNFSPDGKRYAVGGFDGRLGVIDVASGDLVGPRDPVHSGPVAWVTFSPDGKTLASMGFDGELTLSDATTGQPKARVRPGLPNLHGSVGYQADGHTVVVAYRDGSVLTYDTDPAAWVRHACRVAGRDLTDDEWRDAFGGDSTRRSTCRR